MVKPPLTEFQHARHSVAGMTGQSFALPVAAALLCATGFAVPAPAQDLAAPCLLCSPSKVVAEEAPQTPVALEVATNLDFDRLILASTSPGSAELRPDGSRAAIGSVTAISPRATLGEVAIRGEPGRQVRIELPHSIELTGFNGGTIRLESIRTDAPPVTRLDSSGRLSLRFGGIVRVSGDTDGEFRGNVRVNVEYF